MRRLILARAVWCCRNTNDIHRAVRTFLALISSDPQTPYLECIPLAWAAANADPALMATANQALNLNAPAAAQLVGASWLLAGTERGRAMETLRRLATHEDKRIASLADAQLLRGQAGGGGADAADRVGRIIENMPQPFTAGPLLLWGDALAATNRHSEAALAYLRVPVLHPLAGDLAAEAWYRAGKSLEALAWNTLLREQANSPLADPTRSRLEQLSRE